MSLTWSFKVNWSGDGTTMVEEISRAVMMHSKRGRDNYIRVDGSGNGIGFEHVQVGTCTLTQLNSDGRYDPYNTASPLYPYILPGRLAVLTVTDNDTSTTYPVIAGRIQVPRPTSGDLSTCNITIVDGLDVLNQQDAIVDTLQNISIATAIGDILTAVSWPAGWGSSLEATTDVLPYWWTNEKAIQGINDLADAGLGWFFVAANGQATFYNRYHMGTALPTITQDLIGKEIDLPQPWDAVRNRITVVAHPLAAGPAGTVLWKMTDKPFIGNGQSLTYWPTYNYNGAAANYPAIALVGGTDFVVNTQQGGGGADLTASCTATLTGYGTIGQLVVTNSSGLDGYIILLQVRGTPINSPAASTVTNDNLASQSAYLVRLLTLDNPWLENTYQAQDFSNFLKTFLGTPQAFPKITVEARPGVQFAPDLFGLQPLNLAQLAIVGNYYVGSIEHSWLGPNGQAVLSTFQLEPAWNLANYWRFTATIGVTTIFPI